MSFLVIGVGAFGIGNAQQVYKDRIKANRGLEEFRRSFERETGSDEAVDAVRSLKSAESLQAAKTAKTQE